MTTETINNASDEAVVKENHEILFNHYLSKFKSEYEISLNHVKSRKKFDPLPSIEANTRPYGLVVEKKTIPAPELNSSNVQELSAFLGDFLESKGDDLVFAEIDKDENEKVEIDYQTVRIKSLDEVDFEGAAKKCADRGINHIKERSNFWDAKNALFIIKKHHESVVIDKKPN